MKMIRVPIYPSVEVIFPGQLFPIFAETQDVMTMMQVCRAQRQPLGVVHAMMPGGHTLARVGTLAYVLDDFPPRVPAFVNSIVVGQYRFRILQLHQDQAYLEATVELWPWLEVPSPGWMLVERVGAYLRRYVQAIANTLPAALLPEVLPPGVATLGILGAALLPLSAADKQRLIEIPTAKILLSEVLAYMRIYVPLMERLADIPPQRAELPERISLN